MFANLNWKNILTRAAWSFAGGIVSAWALVSAVPGTLEDLKQVGLVLLGGGVAGFFSFVKTLINETIIPTISLRANEAPVVPAEAVISAPAAAPVV